MTDEKCTICRLCLRVVSDNSMKPLEEIANIVQSILPRLNLNIISNPMICSTCNELVQKSYEYKLFCLGTNKLYMEENIHPELLKEMKKETTNDSNNCCRSCSQPVNKNDLRKLGNVDAGMMEVFIPKLDPPLMQNDILCEMCLDNIQVHYNLVEMCSNVEERINIYCKAYANDTIGEVDLLDILEFSLNTDNYIDKLEIKEEKLEDTDLPAGDIFREMNENWLAKEEIPFKDESEVYDTHVDLEALKVESQQAPEQAVNEIALKRTERTYLTKNKQFFVRNLDFHNGTSNVHRFKCHICTYQCSFKYLLTRHNMLVHKNPAELDMFKCHICTYQSKLKYHLTKHMLVHRDPSELDMFKCSQCRYQAKRKRDLKRHIVSLHGDSFILTRENEENTLECTKCTYLTTDKYLFEKHLRVHIDLNELQMFECHNCTYQSTRKYNLKRHMLVHREPKKLDMYSCSQCEYQAKGKKGLKMHIQLVHKDSLILNRESEENALKCPNCTYITIDKFLLKKHLIIHKDSNKLQMFECHSCSYQTKLKSNLKKHMLVHRNPKELEMFKCSHCNYQGKRKQELEIHMLVHKDPSEVTMYKCNECCYETRHKRCLRKHVLVHRSKNELAVKELIHQCPHCAYMSRQRGNLSRHMRLHKKKI